MTLFAASTGTGAIDNTHALFDVFSENGSLAVIIIIIYVIFSSVILLNLFIARLSSTHDKVNGESTMELAYHRVRT